jgi:hypothetical protein
LFAGLSGVSTSSAQLSEFCVLTGGKLSRLIQWFGTFPLKFTHCPGETLPKVFGFVTTSSRGSKLSLRELWLRLKSASEFNQTFLGRCLEELIDIGNFDAKFGRTLRYHQIRKTSGRGQRHLESIISGKDYNIALC